MSVSGFGCCSAIKDQLHKDTILVVGCVYAEASLDRMLAIQQHSLSCNGCADLVLLMVLYLLVLGLRCFIYSARQV